ncbi:MAG: TetR/AcrR family transcriptional regulator [Mycobacterium sp.]|uniref:TetR family transcriptional regulator n=1 Tax=Mycobacterium sp. TaxID=1785 RepID=UPI003C39283D
MTPQVKHSARETRRLQTRQRILGAAIAEFTRSGMAGADVGAVVAAAGVAHGTFYFHFPTKEHVLLELERREEARVGAEFARFLEENHDLETALAEVTRLVLGLEQLLGRRLFKELLALHFSPSRPQADGWTDHPVIVLLVREIERARGDGEVHPEVDAFYSATFFLLGIYGVLTTTDNPDTRDTMLAKLVASAVRGLEVR